MITNQKLRKQVKDEFMNYLTLNKHRKTPERFAILDHIYSTKGHFDMDSLYNSMIEANFRVSRATLYNTIQLLLDSGLVVKHQFGDNTAKYERTFGNENHAHLICTSCGQVWETKNSNIFTPSQQKKIKNFSITYYNMYIYGLCSKCNHVNKLQQKKLDRENELKLSIEKKEKTDITEPII